MTPHMQQCQGALLADASDVAICATVFVVAVPWGASAGLFVQLPINCSVTISGHPYSYRTSGCHIVVGPQLVAQVVHLAAESP
jgi:hypothetical protein